MGQNSAIEWTTHTFNPWRGCTKVSPGCAHCYAEKLSGRNPKVLGVWGDNGTRVVASESYWREALKWDVGALSAGERHRVFCASLADVFEDRPELVPWRVRLFRLIWLTPNLDWLLLTKRPEGIMDRLREAAQWLDERGEDDTRTLNMLRNWIIGEPPANVWLGASVEDQKRADERICELAKVPAVVRFLSIEPLLGEIRGLFAYGANEWYFADKIHWVIVGGESGPGARPMAHKWVSDIQELCEQTGVAFFFKQWGEWLPEYAGATWCPTWGEHHPRLHNWGEHNTFSVRVGKKKAGRMLHGREYSEFPKTEAADAR